MGSDVFGMAYPQISFNSVVFGISTILLIINNLLIYIAPNCNVLQRCT